MTYDDETPGETAWRLILSDDPAEIARIEAAYGRTQAEAVENFIEDSCWREMLPAVVGGHGTPRERLAVLRAAYEPSAVNEVRGLLNVVVEAQAVHDRHAAQVARQEATRAAGAERQAKAEETIKEWLRHHPPGSRPKPSSSPSMG